MKQHQDLIQQLADCAAACQYCSDQCLDEDNVSMMVSCIRLDRDCADACLVALNFVARGSETAQQAVAFCRDLCKRCGDECSKHEAQHCQQCADACKKCEQACEQFLG